MQPTCTITVILFSPDVASGSGHALHHGSVQQQAGALQATQARARALMWRISEQATALQTQVIAQTRTVAKQQAQLVDTSTKLKELKIKEAVVSRQV